MICKRFCAIASIFGLMGLLGNITCAQNEKADPGSQSAFKIPENEKPFWDSAQEFVNAYASRDAKLIGQLFTEDAEFLDEFGERTHGRDAIVEHFEETFQAYPDAVITSIDIKDIRLISESVALENGFVTAGESASGPLSRAKYAAIHKRGSDGKWRIDVLKDFPREELGREEQLAQLNWMVGDWVNENTDSVVKSECDWSEDGNFLLRRFTVELQNGLKLNGVQRTGWDPVHKKLRSWTFDSEGGFLTGFWTKTNAGWVLTGSGFVADGRTVTASVTYQIVDAEMLKWNYTSLMVGDQIVQDFEPITMVRQPPTPKLSKTTLAE